MKRALTHVGGAIERGGDPTYAAKLEAALDVDAAEPGPGEGPERAHIHGFHTYPARMHPDTAARLVGAFSSPGDRVVDPFVGSGTVLVEAVRARRVGLGSDLNPLAVELARLKTRPIPAEEGATWVEAARALAKEVDQRRLARVGAPRRFSSEDVEAFAPHVLLELGTLQHAIFARAEPDAAARSLSRALKLVLSSLLVKLSHRASDTSRDEAPKRIAAGYPARLFVKKTEELVRRLLEAYPPTGDGDAPYAPARILLLDARDIARAATAPVDLVVTSPPYAATYDYLRHHDLRLRWLGLDRRAFAAGEIGARRDYEQVKGAGDAEAVWREELASFLGPIQAVLRPGGLAALVIADSAVRGKSLRAEECVADAADAVGLEPVARATQARPHFHRPTMRAFERAPRREHALLLRKPAALRRP